MTYMPCPLCRERVIGGGIDELSENLTEHLRERHRMRNLPSPYDGRTLRPTYDVHDKNSVGTRWSSPGAPVALVPDRQEVTDFVVLCPFCHARVRGRSENDLGEEVQAHWYDAHGIRPRNELAMPLEWGGRRRR